MERIKHIRFVEALLKCDRDPGKMSQMLDMNIHTVKSKIW